ncbi:MAG: ABC transporter ATP-binding protein [Alphaproteobacteria bacterium]|jgi:peptide/nickel transport system ATP-binding protein|nr:ABC transporter ATP-binding protein [Alphaproteobacteria bacterium]
MTETLLELKGLEVTFKTRRGTLKAVDDLSLSIKKGEILGIVGESGAGKSMTGAAIIGLIDPPGRVSAGEVWFEQERVDAHPERLRGRQISMVFQDPLTSLNPLRTVGDQLIETILVHMNVSKSEAVQRARDGLAEVGIDPDRLNAYPHAFSGGMRQRVVVALALATEPKLVIADEPTTALDVSVQAQVLDLLKKLCRERGTSVMLITHDMGVIAQTSDRIAVMYAGRLAEIGSTREVLTNPQHPYTQGLMASTPSVDAKSFGKTLFQIPGSMPKLDALPNGCAFNPRCNQVHERCRTERPPLMSDRAACWLMETAS